MATLQTLMDFVIRRVRRADLTTILLENATDVYQTISGCVPFVQLQEKSAEIVIPVDGIVDLASLPIAGILSVRLCYGVNRYRRLRRSHSRVGDEIGFMKPGNPATYFRFGTKIEILPTPSDLTNTIRLRYWKIPTIVANPSEATTTLLWPAQWDSLGKYEVLYRTLIDLDEHEKAAWLMQPSVLPRQPTPMKVRSYEMGIIPRLWNDLLKLETDREGVDEDFSINPLVRNYSMRG